MNILVLGNGGREHAIITALLKDTTISEILCAPGNAGIAQDVKTVNIDPSDAQAVVKLAQETKADLVVIGPEAPLVAGVADALRAQNITVFGPDQAAAQLEASKTFAKKIMQKAGIPTAQSLSCSSIEHVTTALEQFGAPYVVKDDGLAGGKGVVVTTNHEKALKHAQQCLDAGNKVVIEEYLDGPEVSLFAICDGKIALPLQAAQDFKRALDQDQGPNTGGMGAYTPLDWLPKNFAQEVIEKVAQPCLDEMAQRGTPFVGLLYCGLAVTKDGIKVVEFNARFGDPETQVVLSVLKTPLAQLLYQAALGKLNPDTSIEFSDEYAVDVILASGGYPLKAETGFPILGLDNITDAHVIHAGTALSDKGEFISSGGRVLATVAQGKTLAQARQKAYNALEAIELKHSFFRHDIALQASEGRIKLP
ncbi:MAG: phosphoribosylamine--glycine ligase [Micrococcaceae bacterium]